MMFWPVRWETSGKFLKGKLTALSPCSLLLERGYCAYDLTLTRQLRATVHGEAKLAGRRTPVTTETSRGAPTPNLSLKKAPETRTAIVCDVLVHGMLVLWVSLTFKAREAIGCFSTRCLREKKKQRVKVEMCFASCCPIPATRQYRLKWSSDYEQILHRATGGKGPLCTPHGQQYAIICSKSY